MFDYLYEDDDFEDGETDAWLYEQEMATQMEEQPHMLMVDEI